MLGQRYIDICREQGWFVSYDAGGVATLMTNLSDEREYSFRVRPEFPMGDVVGASIVLSDGNPANEAPYKAVAALKAALTKAGISDNPNNRHYSNYKNKEEGTALKEVEKKYVDICDSLGWMIGYCDDGTVTLTKTSPIGSKFTIRVGKENFVDSVMQTAIDTAKDESISLACRDMLADLSAALVKAKSGKDQDPTPAPAGPFPDIRVETPLGAIIVKPATDPEYPGVYIDLRRSDFDQDMPLALIECCRDEENSESDKERIITRVWGNAMEDEYTARVVHENVEEFFRIEEFPVPKIFPVHIEMDLGISPEDIDRIMRSALSSSSVYRWAWVEPAGRQLGKEVYEQISRGGTLTLHDKNNTLSWELNLDKFLKGIELYIKGTDRVHAEDFKLKDLGDIDGSDADMIVQYALFSGIIYED